MIKYLSILFFLLSLQACHAQSNQHLFEIFDNDKIGFIDSNGNVIIPPIFRSAEEFSEGLASARINGTYGFINSEGKFVIQPQFDYATEFSEGLAIVFIHGKPFYINSKGQKEFETNFYAVTPFNNGRAEIKTITGKCGYIDEKGKLIIDTIFRTINPFKNGYAVVKGLDNHSFRDRENNTEPKFETGVIDTTGRFIIPYGKYEQIHDFQNGYFRVKIPAQPWDTIKGSTSRTGLIEANGKLVTSISDSNKCEITGDVSCGFAKMSLYKYWIPETAGTSYTTEKVYGGFINLKGKVAINDTNYIEVSDFANGRAIVKNKHNEYALVNTKGNIIGKTYNNYNYKGFQDGKLLVSVQGQWGIVDTDANFILKPKFTEVEETGVINDYFFFALPNFQDNNYDRNYGVANTRGDTIIKPIMQSFDRTGFHFGLLRCLINGKMSYVNMNGKIVWQENENKINHLKNLNIDFMNRGYFYAYSEPYKTDIGGFGKSNNFQKKILNFDGTPANVLSVIVDSKTYDTASQEYKAFGVKICNTTKNELHFNAEDSRLYMKVQAKDADGQWNTIEYLPSSWCGNSYHILTLESNKYWQFFTPVYEGDFKTKLRIELKYIDPADKPKKNNRQKEITIYSNEYDGSINPGQFWRKQEYFPNGIMDPYND